MSRANVKLESSYDSTRLDANRQQTVNLYPHTLRGYRQVPGYVTFADFLSTGEALTDSLASTITDADGNDVEASITPGGADRGIIAEGPNQLLYQVTGSSLYSVDTGGNALFLGNISNDPNPVVMATDSTQLIICTGGNPSAYVYTVAAGLQEITDTDLDTTKSVAFLDSRFIYDQPNGYFVASALNDGTDINSLDFAQAEALPDDIRRVFSLNQLLYLFGEKTTEVWFTSGTGRPPLDRQTVLQHGICGTYAVDAIDGAIYFIDGNRRPGVIVGSQFSPLYVPAIGEAWANFGVDDFTTARVSCYSLHQENFVDFIFPDQGVIWTHHVVSGSWFEKDFVTTNVVQAFNLVLAAHATNKKIYRLDYSNFQQDGSNMTRRKDLPLISSEVFGVGGAEMVIDQIKLHVETSTATDVTVKVSKDLISFTTINTVSVNGNKTIDINALGKCREIIVRVETTTDAKVDIINAAIDAQVLRG